MRSIDLSLYADRLAGEAASLAARIEREHGRLRQAAIAQIDAGEFVPAPSEFTCSGCPALDLVCAGPRLGGGAWPPPSTPVAVA